MRTDIVAAGIVVERGNILLSRRKKGTHLAGRWEFPGGKVEPGEDPRAALRRELEEELGILVEVGEIADVTVHRYDDAEVKWAGVEALDPAEFPPADVAVLTKVRALLG